jgi:hypothetical protein
VKFVAVVLFFISALLFFGMIRVFLAYKKPGMYPPKKVLKSRALALAGAAVIFLLIGTIFSLFT